MPPTRAERNAPDARPGNGATLAGEQAKPAKAPVHVGRATGRVVGWEKTVAAGIEPERRRSGPVAQSRRNGINPLRRQREESERRTTGIGAFCGLNAGIQTS